MSCTQILPILKRDPRWYALTVMPQHEKSVSAALRNKGLEQFLPLYSSRRSWSDRIKELELPLFPGYVFCRFPFEDRVSVLRTLGVNSIVKFGNEPAPIPDKEIDDIKTMVASRLPLSPWPYRKVGQKVRIIDGPLRDVEGILLRVKGSWRLVLSVFLLQCSVTVEIDSNSVAALQTPETGCF